MRTSVIEVRDMLSVVSVDEVEKRIGKVPGVESVTVNYAGVSATVRYDETRLEIADIKSAVRQSGYESAEPAAASAGDKHEGHSKSAPPPAIPAPSVSKIPPVVPAPVDTASGGNAKQEKAMPDEAPSMTPPGDNAATAKRIAADLGIDRVLADVLPAQKAEKLKELQAEGKKVGTVSTTRQH